MKEFDKVKVADLLGTEGKVMPALDVEGAAQIRQGPMLQESDQVKSADLPDELLDPSYKLYKVEPRSLQVIMICIDAGV